MFTTAPDTRKFFKGSENVCPLTLPTNTRFQRQGQRLLMSMHLLVELADKPKLFEAYVTDMMDKHKMYHLDLEVVNVGIF